MDSRQKQLPGWIGAAMACGWFGVLLFLEHRRPARRCVEPKLRRTARNFTIASLSAAALQLAERPVTAPLARLVEKRRWGLLKRLPLPQWLEALAACILLDYTLYLWHVLTHRVPFLWRFHQVHHVDLDLDASTGLRFHFGELTISVLWRAAQILAVGVSPLPLSIWQTALLLGVMFHHSNVELPHAVERKLRWLVITPRMHGIHHSAVEQETNSNWSSGLTVWDWLHNSLRLELQPGRVAIGVPAYRDPARVTLPKILRMPFGRQLPSWKWMR